MRGPQRAAVEAGADQQKTDQKQSVEMRRCRYRATTATTGKTSSMDLVPHHETLSPATERGPSCTDAAATGPAAAAAAAASSSPPSSSYTRSRRSRHGVYRHEAVQVRGHHYDQLQEEPADQPLSIEIQNQTADHHRDHQWPGLPVGLQRGVQVRAGHR